MSSKKHDVPDTLLDSLLADYQKPEDLIGENGLLKQLTKLLVEKALDAEMAAHLGHSKHEPVLNPAGNTRNGKSRKTLKGEFGELPIEVPRDRQGTFEPQLIPKHQTRWTGFDDKVISLYARGMTVREIQAHLEEMYGTEVSPSLISSITDSVTEEVKAWQARPLDSLYPIIYLDCIHVKVREGAVRVKAVYLAIGITLAGEKEVLGMWLAQTEGAKFWLQVVTELRNRGVQDIFIACVDGLKGFPEAIEAVFPKAAVQLCIVHMVRHSLNYVSWKRRAEVAADLKRIYQSATLDEAEQRLGEFEAKWDDEYLPIGQFWRRNWARLTPFFDYPPEIRKVIYTTNAIESVNMSLRKLTKNRGSFPSDEALLKLFYLALRNISQKWTMPIRDWKAALTRFTIQFEERIPQA
ncbi:IS256 family transposase [Chromobacterium sp. IIBBL 290-4]|uniref:IS256 family transposase n=1 Tax=Chromobacterium sp. IIBBL 290-4 TaxID=2953890 RepID=UPI0020B697E9|nr:IS256 family transposase [Chromobacterium sp. IIBBL 290-4]UTH73528.1 IS256 family transposase [Chromobacterium sp. IIBBL 290-4]UTH73716.1 IS256 family transposase [Chromobacterium sp. IIBBL 290-4]